MRIQVTVPGEPTEHTLGVALEAATRLAEHDIGLGDIPPIEDAIRSGVRWREEPPGEESFDIPSTVLDRGWGDCDDLAPWLAAEMRTSGYDNGASAIAVRTGPDTWHAIVRGSDGAVYDPSRWAGMPRHSVGGACACRRPLAEDRPAMHIGRDRVRVDVPGSPVGLAHECDCEPSDESRVISLLRTLDGAVSVARAARTGDERAVRQLAVIARVLRGEELAHACNGVGIVGANVGLDLSSSAVRHWIRRAREIVAAARDELCAPSS